MTAAVRRVRLRDVVVYVAARVAIGVAARVPQWLGYRAAAALGRAWFRMDGRRRRFAARFLAQAYPDLSERERLRFGAAATASLFKVPLDMARLTRLLDRGGDVAEVMDLTPMQRELEGVEAPTSRSPRTSAAGRSAPRAWPPCTARPTASRASPRTRCSTAGCSAPGSAAG